MPFSVKNIQPPFPLIVAPPSQIIFLSFAISVRFLSNFFSWYLTKRNYKVGDAFYLSAVTLFLGTIFNLFIVLFEESKLLFIFVILIACVTDIFALVGGSLIGKHKLTKISPKKTIEGSVVGTLVATIICTTYYAMFISNENIIKIVFIVIGVAV